jgi:hypothetical protein
MPFLIEAYAADAEHVDAGLRVEAEVAVADPYSQLRKCASFIPS